MDWNWFQRLRALEVCDGFAACGGGGGEKVILTMGVASAYTVPVKIF